jgi:hypothetical protein
VVHFYSEAIEIIPDTTYADKPTSSQQHAEISIDRLHPPSCFAISED